MLHCLKKNDIKKKYKKEKTGMEKLKGIMAVEGLRVSWQSADRWRDLSGGFIFFCYVFSFFIIIIIHFSSFFFLITPAARLEAEGKGIGSI